VPGTDINATAVTFDGLTGATASVAQNLAIEDKINHQIDLEILGYVSVKAGNDFVTVNSFVAPNTTPSVQRGIDIASGTFTVNVGPGIFRENLVTSKNNLTLRGANFGINPNTGSRGAETEIQPFTSDGDPASPTYGVIISYAANVTGNTVDGFTLNGDNTSINGPYSEGGVTVEAQAAVSAEAGISNSTISNNIIKNASIYGIEFYNSNGAATSGNTISNNNFSNFLDASNGIAILAYNNCYTNITNNVMTAVRLGIQTGNFYQADPANNHTFTGNSIQSQRRGLFFNLHYANAATFAVTNNNFTNYPGALPVSDGIFISSVQQTVGGTFTNNNITGNTYGYALWNNPTSNTITISGGTVSGNVVGVYATNYFNVNTADANSSAYIVDGVNIQNSSRAGIFVNDSSLNSTGATVSVAVKNSTVVNNTATGLLISGVDCKRIVYGCNTCIIYRPGKYIDQISNGSNVPATNIDAKAVSFDGQTGAAATLAQNFAIEDKINHKIDWAALGFVSVKAGNDFVTANSFITPNTTTPSIQRGVDAATAGDIENVNAGTYKESNITVNKALTVLGVNRSTVIVAPSIVDGHINSATAGPLSNGFLIQHNDVAIKTLTIDGNANPSLGGTQNFRQGHRYRYSLRGLQPFTRNGYKF